ncbi:MAG: DUF4209 domain-containing protein [Oscillospiraceae bacterium]|nr:DUF4209 domain-containing protein [Oscillospiraceae bacterium]
MFFIVLTPFYSIPYYSNLVKTQGFLYPYFVSANGDCFPDIKTFEPERIEFYIARLNTSTQFVFRNRYQNYLIEYGNKNKKYEVSKQLCEESLKFLNEKSDVSDIDNIFSFRDVLERLIEISLKFKFMDIVENIKSLLKKIIIRSQINKDEFTAENAPSLFLIVLSQSLRNFKKNINDLLTSDSITNLLDELKVCKDIIDINRKESYIVELLEWSRILGNDITDLAKEYGNYFVELAEVSKRGHIFAIANFQKALKVYLDNGISSEIPIIKAKIKREQRELQNSDEMETISHSIKIPFEITTQMDSLVKKYTNDVNSLSIDSCIYRLSSLAFIPSKKSCDKSVTNNSILPFIASLNCMHNGNSIFVGNTEEDWNKYFTIQLYGHTLNLQFGMFIRIWNYYVDLGMNSDSICRLIISRDFLSQSQKTIIERGIKQFFSEDYISAIHILAPQFEAAFRCFFEYYEYPTTGVSSDTSQKEQTFTAFLENEFVKILPEDYLYLIKYIMVEQLGLNIRNNIAHGIVEIHEINKMTTLMVIYLFIVLCSYKIVTTNPTDSKT